MLMDGCIEESVGFLYDIPARFSLSRTSIVSAKSMTCVGRQFILSFITSAEFSVAFHFLSSQTEKNVRRRDRHWNLLWKSWSEAFWYSDAVTRNWMRSVAHGLEKLSGLENPQIAIRRISHQRSMSSLQCRESTVFLNIFKEFWSNYYTDHGIKLTISWSNLSDSQVFSIICHSLISY